MSRSEEEEEMEEAVGEEAGGSSSFAGSCISLCFLTLGMGSGQLMSTVLFLCKREDS